MKTLFRIATVALCISLNVSVNGAENVTFPQVLAVPYDPPTATISYGPDEFQFGQLWLPSTTPARATLVLIHGGCWLNQFDIVYSHGLSSALANEGFAVWSLEYRRTGDEGGAWPGTFEDILAGINEITDIDEIDANNVAILGHSAGGHLALLAGAREELLDVDPELVVGLAAISDVVTYAAGSSTCEVATTQFMGGTVEERPQEYFEANPRNHGLHRNTVLLLGDSDEIVPLQQATLPDARSVVIPNASHFDWTHPQTPAFRRLIELLDEHF